MSAAAVPPAIPASRRAERRVDKVRVVLPVEVYGDRAAGKRFAAFLAEHLGDGFDVRYRADVGVVVRVEWARGGAAPAGAVHAAAGVLAALERVLERVGGRSARHAAALESLLPYVVVKVNG
jgi:hypothetical protein